MFQHAFRHAMVLCEVPPEAVMQSDDPKSDLRAPTFAATGIHGTPPKCVAKMLQSDKLSFFFGSNSVCLNCHIQAKSLSIFFRSILVFSMQDKSSIIAGLDAICLQFIVDIYYVVVFYG